MALVRSSCVEVGSNAMKRDSVQLADAQLEVHIGPPGSLTVCTSHPCFAETADGGILSDPFDGLAQVVTVSPQGLGDSSPGVVGLSRQVDDLESVRRSLGLDSWIFAGPSAGGALGLLYAIRFPQALAGLILSVTTPDWPRVLADPRSICSPQHPDWQEPVRAARSRLSDAAPPCWLRIREGDDLWTYVDASGPRVIEHSAEVDEAWRAWWEEAVDFDVTERLAEIQTPTLLLGGRHDPVVPVSNLLLLHERIHDSELVIFEEYGHTPMLDGPADYRSELQRFLEGL
jgi:proline iminopeptidase